MITIDSAFLSNDIEYSLLIRKWNSGFYQWVHYDVIWI